VAVWCVRVRVTRRWDKRRDLHPWPPLQGRHHLHQAGHCAFAPCIGPACHGAWLSGGSQASGQGREQPMLLLLVGEDQRDASDICISRNREPANESDRAEQMAGAGEPAGLEEGG